MSAANDGKPGLPVGTLLRARCRGIAGYYASSG